MSQSPFVMLEDHKAVRALFRELQKESTTKVRRGVLVDEAIELLSAYPHTDDDVIHPLALGLLLGPEEDVLESDDGQHVADCRPSRASVSLP